MKSNILKKFTWTSTHQKTVNGAVYEKNNFSYLINTGVGRLWRRWWRYKHNWWLCTCTCACTFRSNFRALRRGGRKQALVRRSDPCSWWRHLNPEQRGNDLQNQAWQHWRARIGADKWRFIPKHFGKWSAWEAGESGLYKDGSIWTNRWRGFH